MVNKNLEKAAKELESGHKPHVSHLVVHVGVIIQADIYQCVCSNFSCRRGKPGVYLSKSKIASLNISCLFRNAY